MWEWQGSYQQGEDEMTLSAMGRIYIVDFNTMQQINEDTGTARPVQRKLNPVTGNSQAAGRLSPACIASSLTGNRLNQIWVGWVDLTTI